MKMSRYGLDVGVPPGFDVRLYRRAGAPGETTYPILHAGNFALPELRGDFGSGAVEKMGAAHVLVVVAEHGSAAANTALFASQGRPWLSPADFDPRRLQRIVPGQSGAQYFYQESGRAFCLYVVLGSRVQAPSLIGQAQQVLNALTVRPGVVG